MRDLWRFTEQPTNLLFASTIGVSHPLMLIHKLKPCFYQECFHEAPWFGDVLEDGPGIRAIALALTSQLVQSAEESGAVLGVDPILDSHKDRPLIVFNLSSDDGIMPVH